MDLFQEHASCSYQTVLVATPPLERRQSRRLAHPLPKHNPVLGKAAAVLGIPRVPKQCATVQTTQLPTDAELDAAMSTDGWSA